jgi:acetyl-CoA synthetase
MEQYHDMYEESVTDPEGFWSNVAERLTWFKGWDKVREYDFVKADIKWFDGGKLNASYNCLDRHVESGHGDAVALIWEGNNPAEDKTITYSELLGEVKRLANALKSEGVRKGDRVCIYLQMIPELPIAMLACARIGAVHSVVFGAFSAESLRDRINDSACKMLITQDAAVRGARGGLPMKANADRAVAECPSIERVVVVRRTGDDVDFDSSRDIWWHEAMANASDDCAPEEMDAEDPLFILYTSGSTGQPKGVLHTTGGYLVYTSYTHEIIFDYREGDVFWCTADIGWVTGHSYIVYGPLANRAVSVMYEGVPNYPDFGRFWKVVEKHKINLFYTAPTALRALMKEGDAWVEKHDRSTLRLLGTVGEPIKEPEWLWYYNVVGEGRCPIVDTWWQTETGGFLGSTLPALQPMKPGSCGPGVLGIYAAVYDENGDVVPRGSGKAGNIVIRNPWPGIFQTIWGQSERFVEVYYEKYCKDKNSTDWRDWPYFAGDGAMEADDGYFRILGRVDDVINVAGHRLGTKELESAALTVEDVAEAAAVPVVDEIRGRAVEIYAALKPGFEADEKAAGKVRQAIRTEIGPIATPKHVWLVPDMPKTRSGKIMRRVIASISNFTDVGDITTLANPEIVEEIQQQVQSAKVAQGEAPQELSAQELAEIQRFGQEE